MATIVGTGGNDQTLIGTTGDDTMEGLGGNDWMQALQGNDVLIGDDGRDALWAGGGGVDYMEGGDQSDTYVVINGFETLVEDSTPTSGEADRILSYVDFDMSTDGANIEVIRLVAHDPISAIGNALNNTMEGNDAVNTLSGGTGSDTYIIHGLEDIIIDNGGDAHDALESTIT
ncbi:MAG: putative hemolysin-type calcium binding protein, partial [Marmoricola sp.]|nr:putative hemolysin-type calcium binding protein [Marmoricola sp.]